MQKSMISLLSFADTISISNALIGFISILLLFTDLEMRFHISISLILIGIVLDGLDGLVARKFRSSSLGEYLESMADMITLAIAPSVFVFNAYNDIIFSDIFICIYFVFALNLFLFFAIVRLASFHTMKKKEFFIGLPTSASTIILLILSYFKIDLILILPTVVVVGALMASDIRFIKPGIKMNTLAAILIFLTIIFGKQYCAFAPILLFLGTMIYCIFSPVYLKFSKTINTNISK